MNLDYIHNLDFGVAWEYRHALLTGLQLTLLYFVLAGLLGMIGALLLVFAWRSRLRLVRWLVVAVVETFRNTPLFVQLIWIHFALPAFTGIDLSLFQSSTIALSLNAAAYMMKYKDMQQDLDVPAPGTSTGRENRTINASKADLKGFEVDLTAKLSQNFTVSGNLGYLDAKYKDFMGDIYSTGTPIDASFLKIRRAPKWTWDLGATYEHDIGPGSFWITGAVHYVGAHEITFLNNPNLRNKGQYLVDGSVNYKINNTTLSVFGKNLANEKGWTIGYDVQGVWSYAAPRPPRIWGVALTQSF